MAMFENKKRPQASATRGLIALFALEYPEDEHFVCFDTAGEAISHNFLNNFDEVFVPFERFTQKILELGTFRLAVIHDWDLCRAENILVVLDEFDFF